jgi:hypothetical protein
MLVAAMLFLLLSAQPALRPTPLEVAAAMATSMHADFPDVSVSGTPIYAEIQVPGQRLILERPRRLYSARLAAGHDHVLLSDPSPSPMTLSIRRPDNAAHPVPSAFAVVFDREYGRLLALAAP